MRIRSSVFLIVVVALLAAPGARAQTPSAVDAEADRLFNVIMSPYCPGRVLANCPSGAAETLRQEVKRDLEAGKPAAEIEAALYRRFGDSIRGLPQTTGVGLLAWVVPGVVFGLTGIWLAVWLKRRSRAARERPSEAEADVAPPSQAMLERLEDELAEIR